MWSSRKFRVLIFDAVISTIVLLVTQFVAPEWADLTLTLVKILQVPVLAYITGVALEDMGAKVSGNFKY